jgi:hypothetical protein
MYHTLQLYEAASGMIGLLIGAKSRKSDAGTDKVMT